MAKLKEYREDEDWEQYVERLEFYFEAKDITNEAKMKATLLTFAGRRYRFPMEYFGGL